jgi:periplasmic divalent cation tolerance protein
MDCYPLLMASESNFRIMLTTTGSEDEAQKIANALVERRLAACVNIVPQVQSLYRWEGKVESAQEWLLIVKTRSALVKQVEAAITQLHSYELPECIVLNIEGGSDHYLAWMKESLGV